MNEKEIAILLARVPLFRHLSSRQLQNLAKLTAPREYPAGAYIVTQGEEGIGLFVVIEGQADAVRTYADDRRVVVNRFGANDLFGEMALLDEGKRTASVIATSPTRCLVLPRWDFMSLLKTDNELTVDILNEMARRFRIMLDAD
jgi:CRP-like cAMP-binding protein